MSNKIESLPLVGAFARWLRARTVEARPVAPSLTIEVEQDELDGGWVAEIAELPGILSWGNTEQEAVLNVINALTDVLADLAASEIDAHQRSDNFPAVGSAGVHRHRLALQPA